MFVVAASTAFNGFLAGMALSGLGLGLYVAVDLALVVDVLPDPDHVAKDLGLFNIAGALPFSLAPVIAPFILAFGNDIRRQPGFDGERRVRKPLYLGTPLPADDQNGELVELQRD